MGVQRAPICFTGATSTAAVAYEALWREVRIRLAGAPDVDPSLAERGRELHRELLHRHPTLDPYYRATSIFEGETFITLPDEDWNGLADEERSARRPAARAQRSSRRATKERTRGLCSSSSVACWPSPA